MFRAQYRLQTLRRACEYVWTEIDVLVTPTAGTIYRIAQVEADPLRLNSNLGSYTNSVNLLDLAAVAVPAGFNGIGLPFGVTLIGPAWSDYQLLALAARFQRSEPLPQGALSCAIPAEPDFDWPQGLADVTLAVCGAHLDGLPLNHQLRDLGGVLLERTHTAAGCYRFYALPGGPPHRPGLVRVNIRAPRSKWNCGRCRALPLAPLSCVFPRRSLSVRCNSSMSDRFAASW